MGIFKLLIIVIIIFTFVIKLITNKKIKNKKEKNIDEDTEMFYYYSDNQQQGPISKKDILTLIKHNNIKPDTLIWSKNMSDWQEAKLLFNF
jgi:predicted RND superfamily exporter protein